MATRKAAKNWWDCEDEPEDGMNSLHSSLFNHVRSLEEDQADIHIQNILNAKLYSNREPMAFEWDGATQADFRPLNANLENIIQSVVDTVRSIIGKNNPKATVVSRGADFDVYLKSRQLDRFLWACFQSLKVHKTGEKVFDDAVIYGTGFAKVDIDGDEVFVERVNPDEVIVDQRECMSCPEPMTMYHRKLINRQYLIETYAPADDADDSPDSLHEKLEKAQGKDFQYTSYRNPSDDQIVVVEAWRLPVGDKPGRHTICFDGGVLLDEPYTRKRFPFVELRWADAPTGYYGRSLVEGLTGYQIRLNELNADIRQGQNVMCVPRIFADQSTSIVKTQIDNKIGKIITYRGTRPEAVTWTAFNPEIYAERDRVRDSAFRFARVSELSSQAKLPTQARLDSSEALREFSSIEQDGFSPIAKAYERFYMTIAEHLIELYADLYRNKKVSNKQFYRSKYLVEQIDWEEVDMEEDKYVLEVSASSIINMTPAARKDKLNEWISAGLISPDEYKAMSGHPDLERLADLMSANQDYIEMQVDKMLKGVPQEPDPLSDLQTALRIANDSYLHLRMLEAPEHILMLFRDYIELAKNYLMPQPEPQAPGMLMDQAQADQMALQGPPPMPQGQPDQVNSITGAPPPGVSDMAAKAMLGMQ